MDNEALQTYLESHEWLPEFMRDFHDAKRVFKCIEDSIVKNRIDSGDPKCKQGNINWVDAFAYTTDIFLWFMAEHGYTLQKVDDDIPRYSILETLAEWQKFNSDRWGREERVMDSNDVNKRINEVIIKDRKYGVSLAFLNGQKPSSDQISKFTQGLIEVKRLVEPKDS